MKPRIMERPPGKDMWQRENEEKVVMREYDDENTRDDEGTRGYLPPGLRGAGEKGSPRPAEDNRLLTRIVMRPGIRITQDSADPCRGMSTQEPVRSIKLKVRRDAAMGHFVTD